MTPAEASARLGISPREAEVVALALELGSQTLAADEIGISRVTVARAIDRVKSKLNLRHTTHVLVVYDRISRGATAAQAMEGLKP